MSSDFWFMEVFFSHKVRGKDETIVNFSHTTFIQVLALNGKQLL